MPACPKLVCDHSKWMCVDTAQMLLLFGMSHFAQPSAHTSQLSPATPVLQLPSGTDAACIESAENTATSRKQVPCVGRGAEPLSACMVSTTLSATQQTTADNERPLSRHHNAHVPIHRTADCFHSQQLASAGTDRAQVHPFFCWSPSPHNLRRASSSPPHSILLSCTGIAA